MQLILVIVILVVVGVSTLLFLDVAVAVAVHLKITDAYELILSFILRFKLRYPEAKSISNGNRRGVIYQPNIKNSIKSYASVILR